MTCRNETPAWRLARRVAKLAITVSLAAMLLAVNSPTVRAHPGDHDELTFQPAPDMSRDIAVFLERWAAGTVEKPPSPWPGIQGETIGDVLCIHHRVRSGDCAYTTENGWLITFQATFDRHITFKWWPFSSSVRIKRAGSGGGHDDGVLNYAALGDSYSSGVGTNPFRTESNRCYRTIHSYAYQLYNTIPDSAEFSFGACGGAVMHDIGVGGQFDKADGEFPAAHRRQLDYIGPFTDLVTLSIGGNDAGFSAVLAYCATQVDCGTKFALANNGVDPIRANIGALYEDLVLLYRRILQRAPNASVFVLGYPILLSNHRNWALSQCATFAALEKNEVEYLQELNILLNNTIQEAAADAGVHFVDLARSDAGGPEHGVCSRRDRYIVNPSTDFGNKDDFFHPNREGHRQYLEVLKRMNPLDLPANPEPNLPEELDPVAGRKFEVAFFVNYNNQIFGPTEDQVRADFRLVSSADPAEAAICRFGDISPFKECKYGVAVLGLEPGANFSMIVYSDPQLLHTGSIGADGTLSLEGQFPSDLGPGPHTVVLEITESDRSIILLEQLDVQQHNGPVNAATTISEIVRSIDYNNRSHAEILRLYQAIFNRPPDLDGAKYWIDINDQGHDVIAIAGFMSGSQEWRNAYDGTTNAQFVEQVYTNVLGRDFDQSGYDYWLDLVDSGQLNRPSMVFYVTANNEFTSKYPFIAS